MSKDKSDSSITSSNKRKRQEGDNQNTKLMFDSSPNDSLRAQNDKTHDSFIEYLNYNVNRSSMAEESLLLSPIPGDLSRRSIKSVKMDLRSSLDADPLPKSTTKRSRSCSGPWTGGSPGDNSLPKSMNRMLDTSACISLGLGSSLDNTSQSDSDVDWNTVEKLPEGSGRRSSSSFLSASVQEKTSFEEGELSYDDNSEKTEVSAEDMEGQNMQNTENEEVKKNPSEDCNSENDELQQPIQPLENKTFDQSSLMEGEDKSSRNNSEIEGFATSPVFLMSPPCSNKSNVNKTPGSGDKTVRFTPDTKDAPSSEDQNFLSPDMSKAINSVECSSNGLTPRLQALKAKLIRDTATANEILASSSKENYSKIQQNLNENISDDTLIQNHKEPPTPSTPSVKGPLTPEAYKIDSRLSLTPFLKAAKERLSNIPDHDSICPSTSSPIEGSPLISSNIEHSWGSFTPLSQEKNKRTFSIRPSFATIGEGDSYLDQSNDLSSAKKNLNAQSSALLLKVKGAAQKRMQLLAKSRDSLAAKENKQVTKNTVHDDAEGTNAARRVELNGVQRMKLRKSKDSTSFKAKPMPDFSRKGGAEVSVDNKSVTKPISPKLGRILSRPPQRSSKCDHSTEEISFKAKALPRTNSKPSQLPNIEKRPLTVAKSPMLGPRRTDLEKPRSLRRPASVPRSFGSSHSNKLDSPVGLHFVGNVMTVDENIPLNVREPFVLHSTIRAQKRSEFDKNRVTHELQRQREFKLQRERLLKDKYRELDGLKDALR
jgi:hypothetical protein